MTLEMLRVNGKWVKSLYPSIDKVRKYGDVVPKNLQKAGGFQYYYVEEYRQLYRQKLTKKQVHLLEVVKGGQWQPSDYKTWENASEALGPQNFTSLDHVQTYEYFISKRSNRLYRVSLKETIIEE